MERKAGSGRVLAHFPGVVSTHSIERAIRKMFSAAVLDHFQRPRHAGVLADATFTVEVRNPVCGDVLRLAVRMAGQHIAETRFLCQGCTTAIAAASFLAESLTGSTREMARAITADTISRALGNLPPATAHGAQLAEAAVLALCAEFLTARDAASPEPSPI